MKTIRLDNYWDGEEPTISVFALLPCNQSTHKIYSISVKFMNYNTEINQLQEL